MPEHDFDQLLERLRQQVDRRTMGRLTAGAVGTVTALHAREDMEAKKKKKKKKNKGKKKRTTTSAPATTATPTTGSPSTTQPPTTQPPQPPAFAFEKTLGESAYDIPGLLPGPGDVATDGEGNIYVLDSGKGKIVKFSASGHYQSEFGSYGQADGEFDYPYALAVDSDGWMYVADSFYDVNVDEVYRLQVLDATGDFVSSLQPDAGDLGWVSGIAVTSDFRVFASTASFGPTGQIIEWAWDDNDGYVFAQSWVVDSVARSTDGGLAAIDDAGRLYVGYADFTEQGVRVFDTANECAVITTFSSEWGEGDGEFKSVSGIAVDAATGDVFVTDSNNSRVQKLVWNAGHTELQYAAQFGTSGSGLHNLGLPGGVTVDNDGSVYIADEDNLRVLHLQSDLTNPSELKPETEAGQFFSCWAVAQDASKNYYLADGWDNSIHKLNNAGNGLRKWGGTGSADGKFDGPYGIAVKGDRVYVTDGENSRIQIFDTDGVHKSNLIHASIQWPIGLAFDGAGNLYVSNADPDRIEKFDASLNHVAGWGGPANFGPGPMAISPTTGLLHVLDYANQAVQVFTTTGAHSGTYPVDEWPSGIAIDAAGRIYVGSDDYRRLEVLTSTGVLLATLWWDDMPEIPYASDLLIDKDGKLVFAAYTEVAKRFTQTAGRAGGGAAGTGKKADKKKQRRQDKRHDRTHGKGRNRRKGRHHGNAKRERHTTRDAARSANHENADRHAAPPAGEPTAREREATRNPNKRD